MYLRAQAQREGNSPATDSAAQEGIIPFLKRAFILHASKLLGLAVFWAAMRQPGAIGWLLTCKHTTYSLTFQLK